jgi:hypothetical protein
MPLRALRPGRSEGDLLNRRSTLDPSNFFKRGEQDTRSGASTEEVSAGRIAVSQDGGRPTSSDTRPSFSHGHGESTPPVQEATPSTRRFSLMRFRHHASESQLSVKAKEHAARETPPVPTVPANPERMLETLACWSMR